MNVLELREYFRYDKGEVYWRKPPSPAHKHKINTIASGTVDSYGYKWVHFKGRRLKAHRVIFALEMGYVPEMIDHINRVKGDNRIENLREITPMLNQANSKGYGKSGYKGVYPKRDKWEAAINIGKNKVSLGVFLCKDDAARYYNLTAKEWYGDFAYINDI